MIGANAGGYAPPMRKRFLLAAATSLALAITGCGALPGQAADADAGTIIKKLEAANLGLTNVAVQDENTDPNNLLGRPNGYTSRASGDLPGGDKSATPYDTSRGLVVEVFDSKDGASSRKEYISTLQAKVKLLGAEYEYLTPDGYGLVRVAQGVKPSAAKKIEAAVAGL